MMRQVDEAQTKGRLAGFMRKYFLRQCASCERPRLRGYPRKGKQRKLKIPTFSSASLATSEVRDPNAEEALKGARDLLSILEPETSNDTETLGMWGSVHKQLWQLTKDGSHLDEAVRAYERGFYIRNDYYNGINFAFLLNVRAANTKDPAEAIADFIQARRVRKEVVAICECWLTANPEPKGNRSG